MTARSVGHGLLAAGVQLAAGELIASLRPRTRSPVTGLGRALIDLTPAPAVDATVALLEARDKPLLMGTVLADFLGRGAVAGALAERRPRAATVILLAQGAVAGLAAASRADSETGSSALAGIGGGALGAGTLGLLRRRPEAAPWMLAGVVVAGTAARRRDAARANDLRRRREHLRLPATFADDPPGFEIEGLAPLITPVADFYETDVTFPPPALDAADWRLRIHGRVDREVSLSFDELLALGTEELPATLVCVHNPVGGRRIGTARWLGVPVRALLDHVGVRPGADQLLARSVDGFSSGVPLDLLDPGSPALVAVAMNGEPLTFGHGHPARLLVPGLYGYDANVKWLAELELTTYAEVADYWTRRGWPRAPAHVRPGARIDVPAARSWIASGATTIAGVAWAPPQGVLGVDVSVDGGPWEPAELGRDLAPTAWRQWRHELDLPAGERSLRVRTAGQDAPSRPEPPFPAGAGGVHEIIVTVGGKEMARRGGERRAIAAERAALARAGLAAWARASRD